MSKPELLKQHFAHHLNRIYYGKKYLHVHLIKLIDLASFKKLKQGIREVHGDVENQIDRLREIYKLTDITPTEENCIPIIAVFNDAFGNEIRGHEDELLNDIDVILYIQLLEHINITSFRMLRTLAARLNYTQVEQLILESFDEAIDDQKLFVMIADEYLNK